MVIENYQVDFVEFVQKGWKWRHKWNQFDVIFIGFMNEFD